MGSSDIMNNAYQDWTNSQRYSNLFKSYNTGNKHKFTYNMNNGYAQLGAGIAAAMPREFWDYADPVWHIADGRESTFGNAMSEIGVGMTKTGLQTGNWGLAGLGALAKVGGGLYNSAFGVKLNKDNIAKVENNIARTRSVNLSSSNTNEDLLNNWRNVSLGNTVKTSYIGKNGWFNSKASDKAFALNNATLAANRYALHGLTTGANKVDKINDNIVQVNTSAYGGPLFQNSGDMGAIDYGFMSDYLTAKNRQIDNKINMNNYIPLQNVFACGGNKYGIGGVLQSHGADWSNGATHIDEGSTHEMNPNGGVQVGVDREGTPNQVEEGEVIFNDYVYSNRISLDNEAKAAFHINKKRDITYAEMAKRLEKESEERPNDPISQASLKLQMEDLAEQQERQKQEMEAEKAKAAFEALSPEEQVAVMQQAAQEEQMAQEAAMQQQAQPSPEEAAMMQQQMAAQQGMPQGIPQGAPMGIDAAAQQAAMMPQGGMAFGGLVNRFDNGGPLEEKTYFGRYLPNSTVTYTPTIEKLVKDKLVSDLLGIDNIFNPKSSTVQRAIADDIIEEEKRKNYFVGKNIKYYKKGGYLKDKNGTKYKIKDLNPYQQWLYNMFAPKTWEEFQDIDMSNIRDNLNDYYNLANKVGNENLTISDILGLSNYNDKYIAEYLNNNNLQKALFNDITPEQWQAIRDYYTNQHTINWRDDLTDSERWIADSLEFKNLSDYEAAKEKYSNILNYFQQIYDISHAEGADKGLGEYLNGAYNAHSGDFLTDDDKNFIYENIIGRDPKNSVDDIGRPIYNKKKLSEISNEDLNKIYQHVIQRIERERAANEKETKGNQQTTAQNSTVVNAPTNTVSSVQNVNDNSTLTPSQQKEATDPDYAERVARARAEAAAQVEAIRRYQENPVNLDETQVLDEATVTEKKRNRALPNVTADRTTSDVMNDLSGYGLINPSNNFVQQPIGLNGLPMNIGLPTYTSNETTSDIMNNLARYNALEGYKIGMEGVNNGNTRAANGTWIEEESDISDIDPTKVTTEYAPNRYATWPRKLGLFGPAVGLGMMAAGIGKPDYGDLDAALEGYNRTNPTLAKYKPIDNYMRYQPMDVWQGINRLNANARATDRNIMNSGVTQGAKMAGLIANNQVNTTGMGDMYANAIKSNFDTNLATQTFNRGTNQFNAEAFNRTSIANANTLNQDRQFGATLAADIAKTKLDNNAGWYNSLYGNVRGLFKGISDYGRENAEMNWRNAIATTGALGTHTRELYGENPLYTKKFMYNGREVYQDKDGNYRYVQSAEGGKLKRKKNRRGLTF